MLTLLTANAGLCKKEKTRKETKQRIVFESLISLACSLLCSVSPLFQPLCLYNKVEWNRDFGVVVMTQSSK